eukprot:13808964-Heterocapsa_arctica.AAC.1
MIKVDVTEEGKELRYVVDDMVLPKESDNEHFVVEGIIADLDRTKGKLKAIGQRLNDGKEQMFVPFKSTEIMFRENILDYKGK